MWNTFGKGGTLAIEFFVGILLARILLPRDFGLIGMISIFLVISQVIVNSGFSQALIRKKECTNRDYSTVFVFNFVFACLLAGLLYISSPLISDFYNQGELTVLIKVLSTTLIISAFSIVQRTILTRNLEFRLQSRASLVGAIISGGSSLFMAYSGYGVWSLVAKSIIRESVVSVLLWIYGAWKIRIAFYWESFKDLQRFGLNLLFSGLFVTFFNNIYSIVIGKYFSAVDLGYYNRAEMFKNLSSKNFATIITGVGFSALSRLQMNPVALSTAYRKLIHGTSYIIFFSMVALALMAEPIILTLLGSKWITAATYLQLLCFVGMFHPINSLNLNFLNVIGRSDLYLKLQLISQIFIIPIVLLGIHFGIKFMIILMILNGACVYFIISKIVGKYSGYEVYDLSRDLGKYFLVASLIAIIVGNASKILELTPILSLSFHLILFLLLTIVMSELLKLNGYLETKNRVVELLTKFK